MARNEEHTIQFVAKMLWKYRGAVKRSAIVTRLLECDCIRRNYSKGTILNLVQQFRAWVQDPECKLAKKIPHAYMVYLNKYREGDVNFQEDIKEDTKENIEDKVEPATEECMAPAEFSLEEQAFALQQAIKTLDENYQQFSDKINEQLRELGEKGEAARQIYLEKHEEYSKVLEYVHKQIVWKEMMK